MEGTPAAGRALRQGESAEVVAAGLRKVCGGAGWEEIRMVDRNERQGEGAQVMAASLRKVRGVGQERMPAAQLEILREVLPSSLCAGLRGSDHAL